MNAELLLEQYERIAEAPDAIARLRRFILDLAVRGKLVEQDPNDELATELWNRTAAEKAQLVMSGEIRRPKPLPPILSQDIPSGGNVTGWSWVRLGDAATLITKGSTPTSYGHAYTPSGVNFVKVEAIRNGVLATENITSFIAEGTHQFLARSRLSEGDILFSIAGSIGTCAIVNKSVLPANTNQALAIIRGTQTAFLGDFLLLVFRSSVSSAVLGKARGGAMNNVSLDDIQNCIVPLPPLAEQRRIVAKVHELMALCDQLEATRAERETVRDKLALSTLGKLNERDPETFSDAASFALEHLEPLTKRTDQIKQLRQTILNLAVRGKLVEQDPNDEPASELLKFILAAKAKSKQKEIPSQVSPDEVPYQLPQRWVSSRIGDICSKTGSGSTPRGGKEVYKTSGIPFLRSQNVYNDGLRLNDVAFIDPQTHDRMGSTRVQAGDLLLNITGGSMGRCCRIPDEFSEANVSQHVAIMRPAIRETAEFLHYLVLSPYFQAFVFDEQTGAGRGGLPKNRMDRIVVALPPLAEQRRIVAKVDELMSLCDQLETSLIEGEQTRSKLLEAVLHEALKPQ